MLRNRIKSKLKVVVVLSGKRKSGKDYVANKLIQSSEKRSVDVRNFENFENFEKIEMEGRDEGRCVVFVMIRRMECV